MSAFIVSQQTLNNVVVLSSVVMGIECEEKNQDLLNAIINKAYRINDESVSERYNEQPQEVKLSFNDFENKESTVQLIKSFHCWNYQSCEKETLEYLALSTLVITWIDSNYPEIRKTDDYDKAEWDY